MIRKKTVLPGTTRGPLTWNAVVPSGFTQSSGSACVSNRATGSAIGGIGSASMNGVVRGLGGRSLGIFIASGMLDALVVPMPGPEVPEPDVPDPELPEPELVDVPPLPGPLSARPRAPGKS